MEVRTVLDGLKTMLEKETGLPVLYDPQAIKLAEPQVRLTYAGCRPKGVGCKALVFGLSVMGAGDGPGVYLDKVIEASIKVDELFDRCKRAQPLRFESDGETCTVLLSDEVQSGVFRVNDMAPAEPEQWTYVYTEGRSVIVTVPWNKEKK